MPVSATENADRWFLGIEIGGTKLQIGVGRGMGETFRVLWRQPVESDRRAGRIQQQIAAGIDDALAKARLNHDAVAGVGIGFGGPVNTQRGTVVTSHQVPGWDDFPLVEWIGDRFGWPSILHNDADTAAFAEAMFGAGRGYDPVLYITVGSGIGGGLVLNGEIFRGSGDGAMEIGHLRPGNRPLHIPTPGGTVEALASGFGMEARARRVIAEWDEAQRFVESRLESTASTASIRAGRNVPGQFVRPCERFATLLKLAQGDPSRITTQLIAKAAAQGDRLSRELFEDAADTLGWAIAQAVTLINPARIVIGGGVSLSGLDLFFEPVRRACRAESFKPFSGLAEIVPAALGEGVVVHGALALARLESTRRTAGFRSDRPVSEGETT
jgi:glucokinase